MKILHLAPTGNWAGTEEMVCRMANESAREHEVAVAMLAGPNIDADTIRERFSPSVTTILVDPERSTGEGAADVIARVGRPDVIHAHLRPGVNLAWPLRDLAPVIGHLHVRFFSSQMWWVDAVVCVSEWQTLDIPSSYPGAVYRVPNSVATGRRDESNSDSDSLRKLLSLDDGSVVFGSIGRVSPEKGFDSLVSAFRQMAAPQDRLVIIGDGVDSEGLATLADGDRRIFLLGYVPQASRLLPAMDIYVSPSRLDSFGLSVLEAMAAGLPVVATAARGPADLLTDQPARVTPIDDIAAIARAMSETRDDVLAGHRRVSYRLNAYEPQVCAAQLADVYEHVVGRSAAPLCMVRPPSAGAGARRTPSTGAHSDDR